MNTSARANRRTVLLAGMTACHTWPTRAAIPSGSATDDSRQAIIQLGESHRHVLVADVLSHRLNVWQRGDDQLALRLSVHMTLGTGGVGKMAEGDRRTPLGAYRVVNLQHGPTLPAMYGEHAWVLDYPNAWDRALGRTGSGIWLHGTRTGVPPQRSTTGCIVLRNDDLASLHQVLGSERPWVLIIAARAARAPQHDDPHTVRTLLTRWQRAMLRGDSAPIAALYATADFAAPQRPVPRPVSLGDVSAFALPQRWVIDFTASDGLTVQRRTQHWKQVGGQWKIAAEGASE